MKMRPLGTDYSIDKEAPGAIILQTVGMCSVHTPDIKDRLNATTSVNFNTQFRVDTKLFQKLDEEACVAAYSKARGTRMQNLMVSQRTSSTDSVKKLDLATVAVQLGEACAEMQKYIEMVDRAKRVRQKALHFRFDR